eukprot:Skav222119  [mRNA]  locus=scaffold1181:498915:499579:- [translate_table: standard]
MMKLNLLDAWSAVGVKLKKRGADLLTQQAFAPVESKLPEPRPRARHGVVPGGSTGAPVKGEPWPLKEVI